jgi:hypothetical protein
MIPTLGAMVDAAGDFDELRAGRIDRWYSRASELWNVEQIALGADGS